MEWTGYLFTGANGEVSFIRTYKPTSYLRNYTRKLFTASQEFSMANKLNLIPVGMSHNPDPVLAAEEAAQVAMQQLPRYEAPGLALAFCGGRHDEATVLQGLRSQLGEVEIIGGVAIGTITGNLLGYSGYECAVALFPSSLSKSNTILVEDMQGGELEAGRQLGARLRQKAGDGDTVLLFYDSLQSGPPPVLYVGSRLVEGIYQGLQGKQVKLIGAGLIGDYEFKKSYIFDGQRAVKHAALAVILPSMLHSHTTILHGCKPASAFLKISRIEGPVVYELDGHPALEVLTEMLGQAPGVSAGDPLPLAVTLGQKQDDSDTPGNGVTYVNRLIIGANPKDGSITLFEGGFEAGTAVQVMSRDHDLMTGSARQQTRQLLASLNSVRPVLAFYIDCAGRSCAVSGSEVEEAGVLQAELGPDIPLLGFYAAAGVAPLPDQGRSLDWTGALTLFTLR